MFPVAVLITVITVGMLAMVGSYILCCLLLMANQRTSRMSGIIPNSKYLDIGNCLVYETKKVWTGGTMSNVCASCFISHN